MRILHTSDWHFGKTLSGYSRLEEQEMFVDELKSICVEKNVDVVIVAGDVFDSYNPSAKAEELFFSALKRLSENGKRTVIVIAGNHDSPLRLTACAPLAEEFGIIISGTPKTVIKKGIYNGFSIEDSEEGFFEMNRNGEKLAVITMPYPNEKTLDEIISVSLEEKKFQESYSDKIKEIFNGFSSKFRDDTINIVVGHFFTIGGESSDSERNIQLGGAYAVDGSCFPANNQYVALGHLHRAQCVKSNVKNAYYSGSPIQYSKSEINYSKCVYIADITPKMEAVVEKVLLRNYKPIEIWKFNSVEEAVEKCSNTEETRKWIYIEIKTDKVLSRSDINTIYSSKNNIVEVLTIFNFD